MSKLKIKILSLCMAILACTSLTIIASGLSPYYASTSRGVTNSVTAYCQVGHTATGLYGSEKGKQFKNCKVRIKEGSYNSGWVTGTDWANGAFKRAEESKTNNVLYTCYANWSWVYK